MIPIVFTKQNIDLFLLSPYTTFHGEQGGVFLHHSLFNTQCRLKGDPEKLAHLLERLSQGMDGEELKKLVVEDLKACDADTYVNTLIRLGFIE